MVKTDYSNPKVMKEVVRKAKEAGIFNTKLNKKSQHHIFTIKVSAEDALHLNMFNNNKNYGYKLRQANFILGLSSQYSPKKMKIDYVRRTAFLRYIYQIDCLIETKSVAQRAWDKVKGKPLKLFFESKDRNIEVINVINGRFEIQ